MKKKKSLLNYLTTHFKIQNDTINWVDKQDEASKNINCPKCDAEESYFNNNSYYAEGYLRDSKRRKKKKNNLYFLNESNFYDKKNKIKDNWKICTKLYPSKTR